MTDETRRTESAKLMPSTTRPPRQIIEDLIEGLRKTDALSTTAKKQFDKSIELLDQCIKSRNDEYTYADAIERAPWLTADVEHLKRNWHGLRHILFALCQCAVSENSRDSLVQQLNEFAERFIDCEAEEQCLLQAAFPGPAWTDENLEPF